MAAKEFPLAIIIRTIDKATKPLEKIGADLDRIGKKMAKVGRTLTAHLTLPILAIGAAAVKAKNDFEASMSNVSTLIDGTTESMEDMSNEVLAIARRTPVALAEIPDALYNIRSAGVAAGDAMGVLEKSAQLAVAGLSTTAEAADIVTSSINAFHLEGAEAAGVYDVLFTGVKHGKTTLSQLAQGYGAVAGKVAAAGIANDEYIASVAALTTVGTPASQVHSQMAAVLAGLTRKTKETSAVFKKLGAKDLKDLIAKSGGLVPALEKISGELGGNEAKILKLVGSTEAMGAMMGIVGGQNEAFVETLADMRDGSNEVDAAFRKQNSTSQAQWTRTKNSLTSAAISIGTILAPALQRLAEKLQSVVGWFEGLDQGTKDNIVRIAGLVAVVGPSLLVIGKLASVIGMVSKAVRVMTVVMMANPVAALAAVIGLAALSIYENWGDFEDFFKLLWDGVKAIFQDALEFIEGIVRGVVEAGETVTDVGAFLLGRDTSADKSYKRMRAAEEEMYAQNDQYGVDEARLQAADAKWEALMAKQGLGKGGDGANGKSHVTVEVVTPPGTSARVKAIKGSDAVDVTTGPQTGF